MGREGMEGVLGARWGLRLGKKLSPRRLRAPANVYSSCVQASSDADELKIAKSTRRRHPMSYPLV